MSDRISLVAKASALLVMDFQIMIVEGYAANKEALLARTARLIEAARSAGVMLIYVVVGFRRGYPEISPRNLTFGAVRAAGRFAPGDPAAAIHPAVAPKTGDVVVTKHRVSAFAGTDLDMILRANGIDTLLLTGIATSGVVLSTVRHAADADYRLLVIGDCCSDQDEEVHRVLVGKVFARQAMVVTGGEIIEAL